MSKNRVQPVFFDPDRKRWPRLRRGVYLTGLLVSSVFGVSIFSILINPLLPASGLPSVRPKFSALQKPDLLETDRQRALQEAKRKLDAERNLGKTPSSP